MLRAAKVFNAMEDIEQRLLAIHRRIELCTEACHRDKAAVRLLAVSKTRPVSDIKVAIACGQRHFGENYLQEAEVKIAALASERICWHYIGPIQSNKTRAIANSFDWVHSVDRLKIAHRLSEQRDPDKPPLNICLQVNVSSEATKAGLAVDHVITVATEIAQLKGLRLRGLMGIPRATPDFTEQRLQFRKLQQLLRRLQIQLPALDTLSMGMSNDMEAAIMEGATWLRIGTAIFGPRPAKTQAAPN
jgi:pyridoxal phosphate enzyme (YggS family)